MTLLSRPRAGWYTPVPAKPRGRRLRHERLLPNEQCPCESGRKFKRCHRGASKEELAALGPRAANLDQILDAARPLHIDPDVEGYPLIRSGSCFLVTFRGDLWIVSTAHAIKNQGAAPRQARALVSLDAKRAEMFIPTGAVEPLDGDEQDTAWRDFVLLRCARTLPRWMRVIDLDRTVLADLDNATSEDWLRVCGFPNEQDNVVLYPEKQIHVSRLNLDGQYAGRTESKFVHSIRFESTGPVASLNGMSGGPVFYTRGAVDPFCFAGILVSEGAPGSGLARFIDARQIEKTLRWHYDENPDAQIDPSKRRG